MHTDAKKTPKLFTQGTGFPDVSLAKNVEACREDGEPRLLKISDPGWTDEHIQYMLPRWQSIWRPRGIILSSPGNQTFLIEFIGEED